MRQSFRILMTVETESDEPLNESFVKRTVENLRKVVEEIATVKVHDCDENK
jgi:hypothetical protein